MRFSTFMAMKRCRMSSSTGESGLPDFSPRQAALQRAFIVAFKSASPDFQDVHGYASDKDTKVNLTLASKYVGHTMAALR